MADRERLRSSWTAGDIAAAVALVPEPELEAIVSQTRSLAEPFGDGMSTPQKEVSAQRARAGELPKGLDCLSRVITKHPI